MVALAGYATPANADPTRYAVVVGNNHGDSSDPELRYAERDAERIAAVLTDLGGFPAANVVVLLGGEADALRSTVIAVNERIRREHAGDAMLMVYYSGHADATALHLGRTPLAIDQLEQLVRGSAASFRLLALDSCRSGVLTRVKGGVIAPPIPITVADRFAADGVVFWTASAASEDAQESDDVQGSFFTHYLVSGLSGPADVDGDGAVTTGEAFEYARAATLRASSRTLAGPQHATFRDEVSGRQDLVLTNPGAAGRMAAVEVPASRDVVVMADSEAGRIVGEIAAHDRARRMALRPGRYFVRERAPGYLLEGLVTVTAGAVRPIRDGELARVAYAPLVRKGGQPRQSSVSAGIAMRTGLLDGSGPCAGAIASYAIALPRITVAPRIGLCREHAANDLLDVAITELSASVNVAHVWDVAGVGFSLGGELGGAVLHEAYTTTGVAPSRTTAALSFGVTGGAALQLTPRLDLGLETDLLSYRFRLVTFDGSERSTTVLVLRGVVALGLAW
jgi:hypothetical protein